MSTPFASGCPSASRIASRLCAQVLGCRRASGPEPALRMPLPTQRITKSWRLGPPNTFTISYAFCKPPAQALLANAMKHASWLGAQDGRAGCMRTVAAPCPTSNGPRFPTGLLEAPCWPSSPCGTLHFPTGASISTSPQVRCQSAPAGPHLCLYGAWPRSEGALRPGRSIPSENRPFSQSRNKRLQRASIDALMSLSLKPKMVVRAT